MFYLYGLSGPLFAGPLEQLRSQPGVRPVARTARAAAVRPHDGSDAQEPGIGSGAPLDTRHALAAYASPGEHAARHRLHRADELMSQPAQVVPDDATVGQAWEALVRHGIGQAPVVDRGGRVVGLIGRVDLMAVAWDDPTAAEPPPWAQVLARPVRDRMWTPVPTCAPATDLRRVAELLLVTGLPGLAVTAEDGHAVGFVARSDLLRAMVADPPLDLWG